MEFSNLQQENRIYI